MRAAIGFALLLGLIVGVAADGLAQQRVRDRLVTALQVQQCTKGDRQ